MKVLVAVALFAFVAVQLSHAAPAPGDEKKEELPVSPAAAESTSQAAAVTAVKAEPSVDPPAAAKAETPAAAEEKKA